MLMRICYLGICLILSTCTTITSRQPQSHILTTSDRLKEFSYVVSGNIQIPTNRKLAEYSFFLDKFREVVEHSESQSMLADFEQLIQSPDYFKQKFEESYETAWPTLDSSGHLDQVKAKYWIARQLKYSLNSLSDRGISLTLKSIKNIKEVAVRPDSIEISYVVTALGAFNFTKKPDLDPLVSPLREGDTFVVPLNELALYQDIADEKVRKGYQDYAASTALSVLVKDTSGIKHYLENTSKNKVGSPCFISDSSNVSPYNFFYYYASENPECTSQSNHSEMQITKVDHLDPEVSYPEFHRLMEDNEVSIMVMLNDVDGAEESAADYFREQLIKEAFFKVSPDADKDNKQPSIETFKRVIKKQDKELVIKVDIALKNMQQMNLALKTHEIIIYWGHAGYGANISSAFENQDAFPDQKYQILMLSGCNTYKYGMVQLLNIKALKEADFYQQNMDLISTHSSIHGNGPEVGLILKLSRAFDFILNKGIEPWSDKEKAEFERSYSWLSIVTDLNAISDARGKEKDNGIFMVSGEEHNDYQPGKMTYLAKPGMSEDELLDIVNSLDQPEPIRQNALASLINFNFNDLNGTGLRDTLAEAKKFCLNLSIASRSLAVPFFYLPECQLKKISFKGRAHYQGYDIADSKPLYFFKNGAIQKMQLLSRAKIEKYASIIGAVSFYETGHLQQFFSTIPFTGPSDTTLEGGILLFPDGKVKMGFSNAEVAIAALGINVKYVLLFDNAENILGGTFKGETTVDGYKLSGTFSLMFYDDYKIKSLVSQDQSTVQGNNLQYSGSDQLSIIKNPDGSLKSASAYEDGFGYEGKRFYSLSYYPNSKTPKSASYASDTGNHFSLPCAMGSSDEIIYFDSAGDILGCKAEKAFTIYDETVASGRYFMVDRKQQKLITEEAAMISFLTSMGIDVYESSYYENSLYLPPIYDD